MTIAAFSMSLDLRSACGHFATGVTIVTAMGADGTPVGMTANSFSSLSLDPPLVLWSIAETSSSYEAFKQAEAFAVHVLHAGQMELATRFATRGADRFTGLDTLTGESGAPLLGDYHARFDCRTHAQFVGGDHLIIVGRVLATAELPGEPLVIYRGRPFLAPVSKTAATSASSSRVLDRQRQH